MLTGKASPTMERLPHPIGINSNLPFFINAPSKSLAPPTWLHGQSCGPCVMVQNGHAPSSASSAPSLQTPNRCHNQTSSGQLLHPIPSQMVASSSKPSLQHNISSIHPVSDTDNGCLTVRFGCPPGRSFSGGNLVACGKATSHQQLELLAVQRALQRIENRVIHRTVLLKPL